MSDDFQTRQVIRSKAAVRVDDSFIDGLRVLIGNHQRTAARLVAEQHGVTASQLTSGRGNSDAITRARAEFKRATRLEFVLTFVSSYSFNLDDLEHVSSVLRTQDGEAEVLFVSVGYLGPLPLRVELDNGLINPVTCRMSGPKREVDYLFHECRNLLNAAAPEHSFLHTQWPYSVAVILIGFFVAVAAAMWTSTRGGDPGTSFSAFILAGLLASGLAGVIMTKLKKLYPSVEFAFGQQARKRKGRLGLLAAAGSLFILPWIWLVIENLIVPA